jgi:hypothetical protein
VIDRAINIPSFQSALLGVAEGRAGMVSNRRLGRWLKHVEGKIVSGFRLMQDGIVHGYPKWKLIQA